MRFIFFLLLKCGVVFLNFYSFSGHAQPPAAQEKFSIRLKQAPLVATLQQLALEQNENLVLDDEIEGSLSLKLDNVSWEQLLKAVAKSKQFALSQENGIYYLTKQGAPTAAEPPTIAGEAVESDGLDTATVKLQFAKASEVMKSLTTGSGSLLSPSGSISFDDRSNMLLIQDDKAALRKIRRLIAELDKPIEQIAIEARIVTMTSEGLEELGVRWGIFEAGPSAHRVAGSLEGNGLNVANNLNVNFPTNTTPAGSIAMQVAKIHGRLLDLELTALEQEKQVDIIASPRLLTTNKKSASIKQGTEIPYVVTNKKSETESIEFREAVLGLEVTPHISKDNSILLDLLVSQNSPGSRVVYGNGEIVSIDKQEINTQVFAKDGETIVLGGIFHDTVSKTEDKVPLLGDIPVIKHLFKRKADRHQKRELVIFVTPHIIKPEHNAAQRSKQLLTEKKSDLNPKIKKSLK
ncbi:type IV pilus secretin PilQ [Pasteurellaceae bacterium LIM206]|nr:type IV pilus secretin PilQ [Pasteurellaceae bacterium LIM206]